MPKFLTFKARSPGATGRYSDPCLMCATILLATALTAIAADSTPTSSTDPAKSLADQLSAMKDTKTLAAHFICEKRLAMLDTPLLSRGRLWIRQGDPKDGDGAVRFSTEKPYLSELILTKGKVIVKSQHEDDWSKTNQSSRPGLTAVMAQLGGWSTGDPGKLTAQYTIKSSTDPVPAQPKAASTTANTPTKEDSLTFILTPTDKDLLKSVKQLTVAIDKTSHHLRYVEILTQQDDATRYWFYDVHVNPELPADIFNESAAPADTDAAGKKP